MNIYIVIRTKCGYDQYDAFVVAANSEQKALDFLDKGHKSSTDKWTDWPNEGDKTAELIGTTDKYTKPTEILGSFNAG